MENKSENKKSKDRGRTIAWLSGIVAAIIMLAFMSALHREEQKVQEEIARNVIRFQVKANSDTQQDQDNKLAVRDAVLDTMKTILEDDSDKAQTKQLLQNNLPKLEASAKKVLRERDCEQPVKVQFETSWFPQKSYGEYTFPPGEYEALKITIGEGDGHNWWCMLYPSLCFQDAMHAVPEKESEKMLEHVLSDEAYDTILRHGKVRFSFFLAILGCSG